MAKAINIKTYKLEDLENSKFIGQSHLEHPLNDNVNEDGISDEVKKILHNNPFLYNLRNPEYRVTSIEDYYIDVKKDTKAFGAVIRGQGYRRWQKRRYTKKAFKKWRQDFLANKDRVLNAEEKETRKQELLVKIKFWYYLGLVFLFFFIALLMFKPGLMWTSLGNKAWFNKVDFGIDEAFSHQWFYQFTQWILIVIICGLYFGTIYRRINQEHKKINIDRFNLYEKSDRIINKEFKKKYKRTRKYYLQNIRKEKNIFGPLPIEETAIEKVDLKEIEAVTAAYVNKTINLRKYKKYFYLLKYLTIYGALISGIFIFGYVVYFIIKNIL